MFLFIYLFIKEEDVEHQSWRSTRSEEELLLSRLGRGSIMLGFIIVFDDLPHSSRGLFDIVIVVVAAAATAGIVTASAAALVTAAAGPAADLNAAESFEGVQDHRNAEADVEDSADNLEGTSSAAGRFIIGIGVIVVVKFVLEFHTPRNGATPGEESEEDVQCPENDFRLG